MDKKYNDVHLRYGVYETKEQLLRMVDISSITFADDSFVIEGKDSFGNVFQIDVLIKPDLKLIID